MRDQIYLDCNATTPAAAEVVESMLPWFSEGFGNPSSSHAYGRVAKDAVERARGQVASLIGCAADEIVFTSGGTESNNLAIFGAAAAATRERRGIVTSVVEHPAVERPCDRLEREGHPVARLSVDGTGRVSAEEAREASNGRTALVTVMLANNETGTIQPIRGLSRIAHEAGALMHTDAAQAVGKIPVRVDDLEVDLLTIAGHKLYAPKGVGALYVRSGTKLRPFALGASHERGLRPGTENVPGIIGLGTACEIAERILAEEWIREEALRDELWALLTAGVPGLRLNGHPTERLPNTLNVSFPGTLGRSVLEKAREVAASTGSACHEGVDTPSSVLTAMGLDAAAALGAVRLSLGRNTTREQIATAARSLIAAWMAAD
jgi:cysteine desulfurase